MVATRNQSLELSKFFIKANGKGNFEKRRILNITNY